ncbi:monocyte to macrophage differentiation factor 2 isoform X2 [Choloepus didactylus]|uniref:monocyte to macrophage differentiation factor 2 isoform X2 n=1 Tax=Choloepus didactylus TaxID=27675 RepID=UPI0018A01B80|nr:monocyte to macrophage differentiation factor 2 isoform X2 [Choloepus didactylus]
MSTRPTVPPMLCSPGRPEASCHGHRGGSQNLCGMIPDFLSDPALRRRRRRPGLRTHPESQQAPARVHTAARGQCSGSKTCFVSCVCYHDRNQRRSACEPQLHHLAALSLSFPVCKMGVSHSPLMPALDHPQHPRQLQPLHPLGRRLGGDLRLDLRLRPVRPLRGVHRVPHDRLEEEPPQLTWGSRWVSPKCVHILLLTQWNPCLEKAVKQEDGGALPAHVRPDGHLFLHRRLLCTMAEPPGTGPLGLPHALAGLDHGFRRHCLCLPLPRAVQACGAALLHHHGVFPRPGHPFHAQHGGRLGAGGRGRLLLPGCAVLQERRQGPLRPRHLAPVCGVRRRNPLLRHLEIPLPARQPSGQGVHVRRHGGCLQT